MACMHVRVLISSHLVRWPRRTSAPFLPRGCSSSDTTRSTVSALPPAPLARWSLPFCNCTERKKRRLNQDACIYIYIYARSPAQAWSLHTPDGRWGQGEPQVAACVQVRQDSTRSIGCAYLIYMDETWTLYRWVYIINNWRSLAVSFPLLLQQVWPVQQEQQQDRRGGGEALLHVPNRQGMHL